MGDDLALGLYEPTYAPCTSRLVLISLLLSAPIRPLTQALAQACMSPYPDNRPTAADLVECVGQLLGRIEVQSTEGSF